MNRSLPTRSQVEVMKAFASLAATNGCAPSLEEICEAAGRSSIATIHKHLQGLLVRGYIRSRGFNHSRAYELTRRAKNHLRATPCPHCAGTGCA